ncbi:hypothetical protein FO519_004360 [Halicephalobus sp. NKZ332]|nr:hypothetical protein FO519_004360 [Halicephalobus sp. NKZ332]
MPKGIFHYRKSETGMKNEFKVPEAGISDPAQMASELINTAVAESSYRQEALSGVQIPLPFGLKPLNIQLGQDSETKVGVDHNESSTISQNPSSTVSQDSSSIVSQDESSTAPRGDRRRNPELHPRARKALERTRKICLKESQKKCDLALEEYHRIRFGSSPAADRELLRKAQPQDLSTYVQTGFAKWLVPGLDKKLNNFILSHLSNNNSEGDSGEKSQSENFSISLGNRSSRRFSPGLDRKLRNFIFSHSNNNNNSEGNSEKRISYENSPVFHNKYSGRFSSNVGKRSRNLILPRFDKDPEGNLKENIQPQNPSSDNSRENFKKNPQFQNPSLSVLHNFNNDNQEEGHEEIQHLNSTLIQKKTNTSRNLKYPENDPKESPLQRTLIQLPPRRQLVLPPRN